MKYISILVLALSLSVCTTVKPLKEEPFTVSLDSPKISAGAVQAQFDKIVSITGIRTIDVNVDYYPLEDAVCLEYRIDLMTFYLFLDREGRAAYLKALEQYKEDYTNKTLKTKGSRNTRRQYGNTGVYLIWQSFSFTVRSKANTFVDFGYDIKVISNNRASFFTLYRREAVFIEEHSQQDRKTASNEPMYLTRTQADELAALFDQDFLKNLTPGKINTNSNNTIDQY